MGESITRDVLSNMLIAWREQRIDESAVWQWALQVREDASVADELVRDIVDALTTLPYDLIVVRDVDVFLDALANPLDELDLSINLLWNHLDSIPDQGRESEYAQHPFYAPFIER